jgi:hypothetical protein
MMIAGLSVNVALASEITVEVVEFDSATQAQSDEVKACSAFEVAYNFAPGSLKCSRNWDHVKCYETKTGTALCNLIAEPAGNLVKAPLHMVTSVYKHAHEAAGGVWTTAPGALKILAAPAAVLGGMLGLVKGTSEAAFGTVAAVVEISGEEAVVYYDEFVKGTKREPLVIDPLDPFWD